MRKSQLVFIIAFLLCITVQASLCLGSDYFFDVDLWSTGALHMSEVGLPSPNAPEYGYPGISILAPASLLISLGAPPRLATQAVVLIWVSLLVALITVLAYVLRPQSNWYLALGGLLLLSRIYLQATPPSSLVTLFVTLLVLLFLYAFENRNLLKPYVFIGIAGGVALSTRFDISFLVLGFGLLFLSFWSFRNALIAGVVTLIAFCLTNSYMFFEPVSHLTHIFQRVYHTSNIIGGEEGHGPLIYRLVRSLPLGFFSILFALVLLITKYELPFRRVFLYWLLFISFVIEGALLATKFHADWYFYPILVLWQSLLPLFLLSIVKKDIIFPPPLKNISPRAFSWFIVGSLIGSQVIVFFHPALMVSLTISL